jgi:hypothetical protein
MRKDHRGAALRLEVIRNDGRSGIGYSSFALMGLTMNLDMARNFGPSYDWWERTTTDGVGIGEVVDQLFYWNILNEPFPWFDFGKTGYTKPKIGRAGLLEIAANRLNLDPGVYEWLQAQRANGKYGQGRYMTLLKGELAKAAPENPVAP